MSVSLKPSASLGFNSEFYVSVVAFVFDVERLRRLGPLTQLVKRVLTVTNHNNEPVAFKVKTTAPKVCESQ